MKSIYAACIIVLALIVVLASCETQPQKEERLARLYCSGCHLFPDPGMLDKETWDKSVLPAMAFRMGMDHAKLETLNPDDIAAVLKSLPSKPMVTNEEWEAIRNYFVTHAPDSIEIPEPEQENALTQFNVTRFRFPVSSIPLTTMIKADTSSHVIYVGTRTGRLYEFGYDFHLKDSIELFSAPSSLILLNTHTPVVSTMGIMDPNDQARGKLVTLDKKTREIRTLIDSIRRPVYIQSADLNKDSKEDYVICAFGNYTGALETYENTGNGRFRKHILSALPGARKVIVKDFTGDGYPDVLALLTQGDESINLYTNTGNFTFKITSLLRFPSVYGSSYIDIADFNKDGFFDIIYTNGDNADFSKVFKPYHGIRIFLNDGHNQFTEKWFYPMHGASQVILNDFDHDGDLDIAATSFFPDMINHPERGFIYFENKGDLSFKPYTTHLANSGKWLVMESADLDLDGDTDLMLGSFNFGLQPADSIKDQWKRDRTAILILNNTSIP